MRCLTGADIRIVGVEKARNWQKKTGASVIVVVPEATPLGRKDFGSDGALRPFSVATAASRQESKHDAGYLELIPVRNTNNGRKIARNLQGVARELFQPTQPDL